ncbi:MAG: hypothetical protein GY804_13630 [Alphaproteobacteria bacterium]|nr:hypothetical protein [Alphaproteobacteria bacterium]
MKTEYSKLANPPIVEAVLSVSIDNALFTLENINKFYDDVLAKEYEEKKEIKNQSLTVSFDENEVKHENNVVPVGLSALNKKKNQVFNFEIQKLSISKLAPYESGEMLINDFYKYFREGS